MHNITKEHIELIEEFLEKFGSHRKAEIIYELLKKITGSPAGTSRKGIIQKFAKEKNLTESVVHKWFNAYMNSGLDKLVDYKLLAQQYLLDNPFCIKDGKIMNWSKRSLCKFLNEHELEIDGFTVNIQIKETIAYHVINEVIKNQEQLLEERDQKNAIALDIIEDPKGKLIKTLRHTKFYKVIYYNFDINVSSRTLKVLEKGYIEEDVNSKVIQELRRENVEKIARRILYTVCNIRKKRKWKGKLIVYMPESEISQMVCSYLNQIDIKSIVVNPKEDELNQDDIEFLFKQIEKYKRKKYSQENIVTTV